MARFRALYIFLLTASFAFFIFDASYLAFWCFITFAGILIFSAVYLQLYKGKLLPAFSNKQPQVTEGESGCIVFNLTNKSRFNIRFAQLHILITNSYTCGEIVEVVDVSVPAKQTVYIKLDYTSRYCGIIKAEVTKIVYYDILLCSRKVFDIANSSICPTPITVYVAPVKYPVKVGIVPDASVLGNTPVYSKTKGGNEPPDVFDYREFTDGDSVKWISPKLSAKRDELIVKQYSLSQPVCPIILCDISIAAAPDVLQLAAQVSASLAAYYAMDETGCRLMRYHHFDDSITGGYVSTLNDVDNELEAMFAEQRGTGYDLNVTKTVSRLSPTMLIYITDMVRADAFSDIIKLRIPHLALHVTLEDSNYDVTFSDGYGANTLVKVTPANVSALLGGELSE